MAIDVHTRPNLSDKDKEVLRRVYQTRMDEINEQLAPLTARREEVHAELVRITSEYGAAARAEGKVQGMADELRSTAAADGITLT